MALVACALVLSATVSAQTDTTGRPVPDTIGRPIPDDSTRMPRDKKRSKKDRKMPKDSLKTTIPGGQSAAALNTKWNGSLAATLAYSQREFVSAKELYRQEAEHLATS